MGAGGRSDCWMGVDVFSNCGSRVCRKRGRMYERTDFNSNCFSNNDFVFFVISLMNVCVCIDLLIAMLCLLGFLIVLIL